MDSTIALLEAMVANSVLNFVFSSTCAIFGKPVRNVLDEDHPKTPINPYGRSKLMVETILTDFKKAYGIQSMRLRYVNAAGADPAGDIGEDHSPETHLIPLVLKTALGSDLGWKYSGMIMPHQTAHASVITFMRATWPRPMYVAALEHLLKGQPSNDYNLGTGKGYSGMQVLETVQSVTGCHIPITMKGRCPGDPARLVASCEKAKKEVGWQPELDSLDQIVQTAWDRTRKNPAGLKPC